MTEVRLIAQSNDHLGEGPCWSPREGRLYWFDIKGQRLSWHEPATGGQGSYALPMRASVAVPRKAGGLLLVTERGLADFDPATGKVVLSRPLDLGEDFRSNDGKLDPAGNLWWGTMDNNAGQRPGGVYRTTPDGLTERLIEGIYIPNTMCVSADRQRLYLTDSVHQTIFVYELADLGRRDVFAHTRGTDITPDGGAFDAEGFLWNAQWGGWRVVRYAPDGRIDRIVEMPVAQATSCCFGGDDLSTLYVTSAWQSLSVEARAAQPLAGSLFAFDPGVKGMPLPLFEG